MGKRSTIFNEIEMLDFGGFILKFGKNIFEIISLGEMNPLNNINQHKTFWIFVSFRVDLWFHALEKAKLEINLISFNDNKSYIIAGGRRLRKR